MTAGVTLIVCVMGVLGAVTGSYLHAVAARVPARTSASSAGGCRRCGGVVRSWRNVPVVSWLAHRGRCPGCGRGISARQPVIEAVTGSAFAIITWVWLVDQPLPATPVSGIVILVAFLYFAAIGITLTATDLATHRLPNAIVLPGYVIGPALFALACVLGAEWEALLRALAGMVICFLFYAVIRLIRPDGMGGGDVKLAGVIGLFLGWTGWGALVVGAAAPFFLGGIYGVALLVARRADRSSQIPFGPWMIGGAWIGIVAGGVILSAAL